MTTTARLLALLLVGGLLSITPPATARVATDHGVAAEQAEQAERAERAPARGCANGRYSRYFRDSVPDGPRGVEANGLAVWNKKRDACFWWTIDGRFTKASAQVIRVVIDTDSRYRGYEYEAWAYSPKDGDSRRGAYLIHWLSKKRSEYVSCPVYSGFVLGQGQIRIGVPKSCLGSPDQIRVSAAVIDIKRYLSGNRYRGRGDAVPNGGYTPFY